MSAPIIYCWDEETKMYSYSLEAQLDPLETEKAGKEVYMGLPLNGTDKKPLKEKEGFIVYWDEEVGLWGYKEVQQDKEENKEPTELEKLYQQLSEAESWLSMHDYIGIKIATGRATVEDYKKEIALMDEYTKKVNDLRAKIKKLESK